MGGFNLKNLNENTDILFIRSPLSLSGTTASTSSTTGILTIDGGFGINNNTDASSYTNGGSFTTAGGAGFGRTVHIGERLTMGAIDLDGARTLGIRNASTGTSAYCGINFSNSGTPAFNIFFNGTSRTVEGGVNAATIRNDAGILRLQGSSIKGISINTSGVISIDDNTVSTSSTTGSLITPGGIASSNTTDSSSHTNGGSLTLAGGAAIAKNLYIGESIIVGGTAINGERSVFIYNTSSGTSAYSNLRIANDTINGFNMFLNSSNKSTDGGVNTATIRNDAGAIRVQSSVGEGISISTTGVVSIDDNTSSTSNTTGSLLTPGGIGISNTTDMTSSTNGGTFTSAGGGAFAKSFFVGENLYVGDVAVDGARSTVIRNTSTGTSAFSALILSNSGSPSLYIFLNSTTRSSDGGVNGATIRNDAGAIRVQSSAGEGISISTTGVVSIDDNTSSTSNTTGSLLTPGGIASSNITDASSSTNGGGLTLAGGAAIAKKLYVGDSIILNDSSRAIGMNLNTTETGQTCYYMDAMSSILFSGSAAGVSTGQVTPLISSSSADTDGLYKNSAAQYDFWRTYVNIPAGTYTFRLKSVLNDDRGIVSVVIDGSSVGTIDLYSASYSITLGTITGISISTSGIKKVELQVNSKNASSTGYIFVWKNASFIRTA